MKAMTTANTSRISATAACAFGGKPNMGRRKKSDSNGAGDNSGAENTRAVAGDNSELTDEQRQVLLFQWKRRFADSLAGKKAADAAFKNVCKQMKSELGDTAVDEVKIMIECETEDGEASVKSAIELRTRILRMMGVPTTQDELFPSVDKRPSDEVASEAGKRAGLAGEQCACPHDPSVPQYKAWMDGWHEGQKILVETKLRPLTPKEDDDDADLRPRFNQETPEESAQRRRQENAVDEALSGMAAEQAGSLNA